MIPTARVERDEAAPYYFTYIDVVPEGDICATLEAQVDEFCGLLERISDERSHSRYAPDKWTIREVAGHVNDTERLFAFRAFWFARGFDSPLPSFDQHVAVRHAEVASRPWPAFMAEFRALRAGTLSLFRHLPADAWLRRGIASDNPFTVRALAFIAAGHVIHHAKILRERYLLLL